MGERKVMNKYFPPDFDPTLIPKRKRPKDEQIKVRIMIPFNLQCEKCGEFCYRGTKFNSRSEIVQGEDYLGLKIFRFYIKCPDCISEIIFRTDPKNSDYQLEHGATRNFEPWKQADEEEEARKKAQEQDEKGNAMTALENRTEQSKREMEIQDGLEEIKELNARQAKVHEKINAVLDLRQAQDVEYLQKQLEQEENEDQKELRVFEDSRSAVVNRLSDSASASDANSNSDAGVRRSNKLGMKKPPLGLFGNVALAVDAPEETETAGALGMVVIAKKKKDKKKDKKKKKKKDKDKDKDKSNKRKRDEEPETNE